jgi:hypothetical protein
VNCESLQRILFEQQRELTADEAAHLSACDECMDVLLTVSLEARPEVEVPENFAAQVAARLPAERPVPSRRPRHAGLTTAMVFVGVLLVVCFAAAKPADSWVATAFVLLVATEIAGIALWLAPRRPDW